MAQEIKLSIGSDTENQEEQKPKFDEWEIAEACRTIIRAEEIKQDAELMALVTPKLKEQVKATLNAAQVLYGNENKGN